MNLRRLFILLSIIAIIALARPRRTWTEAKRIYDQRDAVWGMLVIVIGIYLCYGLYGLFTDYNLSTWQSFWPTAIFSNEGEPEPELLQQ
ncbi:MAG: hypothetical protein AAF639_31510 [Chloroflexota bacterium]